jgi:molybdenum cofactor guanylyltransferase
MSIKTPLIPGTIGLVLCGGQSGRMGTDKSMLQYFDKPQRYHVYDMLQPLCEAVFISGKKQQAGSIEPGYSFVADNDSYQDAGPIAALLTAFESLPQKHLLLIGCDYPFLTVAELEKFSTCCKNGHVAAFYNGDEEIFNPMLAWYPQHCHAPLKKMYESKQYSLKHFLYESSANKFIPADKRSLLSIDTPGDYRKALATLKS